MTPVFFLTLTWTVILRLQLEQLHRHDDVTIRILIRNVFWSSVTGTSNISLVASSHIFESSSVSGWGVKWFRPQILKLQLLFLHLEVKLWPARCSSPDRIQRRLAARWVMRLQPPLSFMSPLQYSQPTGKTLWMVGSTWRRRRCLPWSS